MTDRRHLDRLAQAVRALADHAPAPNRRAHDDAPARLEVLEREVQEMRTRVNTLFFAVLTASVADVVGRTVLG